MTRAGLLLAGLLALLLVLLAGGGGAHGAAQQTVDWQVFSAAGAPAASSSGLVALNGSLGQVAIGPVSVNQYRLGAGFWYGIVAGVYRIYLPITYRDA